MASDELYFIVLDEEMNSLPKDLYQRLCVPPEYLDNPADMNRAHSSAYDDFYSALAKRYPSCRAPRFVDWRKTAADKPR